MEFKPAWMAIAPLPNFTMLVLDFFWILYTLNRGVQMSTDKTSEPEHVERSGLSRWTTLAQQNNELHINFLGVLIYKSGQLFATPAERNLST